MMFCNSKINVYSTKLNLPGIASIFGIFIFMVLTPLLKNKKIGNSLT